MRWILIRSLAANRQAATLAAAALLLAGCGGRADGPGALSAAMPLHLEQHIDHATIVGSVVPADAPKRVEWRFDEPEPDWSPVAFPRPGATTLSGYRARDVRLRRTVALKILIGKSYDDTEVRERFARQALIAASLNHPNICTVHPSALRTTRPD